jgi:hypothetical protein
MVRRQHAGTCDVYTTMQVRWRAFGVSCPESRVQYLIDPQAVMFSRSFGAKERYSMKRVTSNLAVTKLRNVATSSRK